MIKKTTWIFLGAALLLTPAAPARAIMLDIDPAAQTVNLNDPATVKLNISGLGAGVAPSLSGLDVDIGFDPSVLSFTSVVFGTGLDLLGLGSVTQVTPAANSVNLLELSLDSVADLNALQPAAFTLATLTFATAGVGTSPLTIAVNALGDAVGDPLMATVSPGSVTVNAVAVPEPATWLLVLSGLLAIGAVGRARYGARPS